ncbi:polysaccharide pyruvyl transferase family protein [Paenibacillus athensensis]|nr:polysaccharide pyruvyl transferase family protein [Paenibacillus athensensis]MCD1259533.1 polysaccharide pyruvyl transferase family protein [Paenibacillus athensensis]
MNAVKNILFINDTYDDFNLGCKATTQAMYELMEERLPQYRVSGVIKLFHTERSEIIGLLPHSEHELDEKCLQVLNQDTAFRFELDKIRQCDIVLINGEGSIYKDVVKCRYQLFLAYLAKKYLGKRVYMVNHTADLSLIQAMAKVVYVQLDGIVAREPLTKAELETAGIDHVQLGADAVFKFTDMPSQFANRLPLGFRFDDKFIIIGGSSLNHPIYEKWYGSWSREDFKELITSIRDHLGVQVMLADVGGDDFLRGYDVEEGIFYAKFTYQDYMLLASKALVHLSGRHHGSCLAAIAGCPLLGLTANTRKMEGDFQLLDWDWPVYSFYRLKEQKNEIVQSLERMIENNFDLRQQMLRHARSLYDKARLNVDILRK